MRVNINSVASIDGRFLYYTSRFLYIMVLLTLLFLPILTYNMLVLCIIDIGVGIGGAGGGAP
jgi:hypothetical protein